eukprot:Gb_19366 [translate_table: standard]
MHIWPSMRIRDSFKLAYLRKVDLNLHRMKIEKRASRNQALLQGQSGNEQNEEVEKGQDGGSTSHKSLLGTCCEGLLLILCCCCCFCCGVLGLRVVGALLNQF